MNQDSSLLADDSLEELTVLAGRITEAERLQDLFRLQGEATASLREGIYLVRKRDAVIVHANERFEEMFGYGPGEMLGKPVSILNAPNANSPEETAEEIHRALHETSVFRGPVQNVRKDGSSFWSYASISTFEHAEHGTVWLGIQSSIVDRRRIEEALQDSEARLRRVLDAMPAAAYLCDVNGLITYFNARACEVWGRAPQLNHDADRFCGSFRLRRPDGTVMRHDQCYMAIAVNEGQAINGAEVVIERSDGSHCLVLAHANPLRDGSGRLIGGVNVLVDITRRKQTEEALRRSEERLKLALSATHTGVWEWNIRTNEVYWSPECLEIFGTKSFGGTLDSIQELGFLPDFSEVIDAAKKALFDRVQFRKEIRIIRADGQPRWSLSVAAGRYDDSGQPISLIGIVQDITERKQAEDELRLSQQRFKQLAEGLPQMVWTCFPDGYCDYVSPQNVKYCGMPAEQLLGFGWVQNVHPDDREPSTAAALPAVAVGSEFQVEERYRRHDGVYRWFTTRGVPIRDAEGKVVKWIGTSTDIDDRKQLEREVLEVATLEQRRIGQALHDSTGQELTALGLFAETLAESLTDATPATQRLAAKVRDGVQRALAQVRAYSRGLIPVEVDSRGLRAALAELATRTDDVNGVHCTFDCPTDGGMEDNQKATHLYHIAQEAVANALRHGKPRNIAITLEGDDTTFTLRVSDDGVGPPPAPVHGGNGNGSGGMGLKIMRYRAGLIQCRLTFEKLQPTGTLVSCTSSKGISHGQSQARHRQALSQGADR